MTLNCSTCCITKGCNCAMTCSSEQFVGGIQQFGWLGVISITLGFTFIIVLVTLVIPYFQGRKRLKDELGR